MPKLMHLTYAHEVLSDCHVAWCGKRVQNKDCVDRARETEVTCKACLTKKAAMDAWHVLFDDKLKVFEAEERPEARREAWLATVAELGKHPRGFDTPKRSVEIRFYRSEDGQGRYEVSAPMGARFISGPHARVFGARSEAERVKGEVVLVRCPEGCGCGMGRGVKLK